MSIQSTVVPQDRSEGVRCVIVQPGDALILSGITAVEDDLPAALAAVKEALGLRLMLVVRDLAEVSVRDLDAELAEAHRQLESYRRLFETQQNMLNEAEERLITERRKVAQLEAKP